MRTYNDYSTLILRQLSLFLSVLLLLGCERRPLEEEVGDIAIIPIKIDWSKSGLDVEKMHRATIRIFPHDGTPAYDFRLQENLNEAKMPLAIGKYSFVIFNETTDPEDWTSLVFKGTDKYEDFLVTTSLDPFRGLYSRTDKEVINKAPEALASWSIDEFEVSRDIVAYTLAISRGELSRSAQELQMDRALAKTTTIVPVTVVKTVHIMARVQNLVSAQRASGAIKGATESIHLSTRKSSKQSVTHIFTMNGRKYDNPAKPQHGTIGATLLVFDIKNFDKLKCELSVDFLLQDGTTTPAELFDVTKAMTKDEVNININVGFDVGEEPSDHPIVLPIIRIEGGSVGVDEWDKVIVPIE